MTDVRDVASLSSVDLATPGVTFRVGELLYRTTGERIGQGGMGSAFHLAQWRPGAATSTRAVAKLFRDEFLAQVVEDRTTLRHFEHNVLVHERLRGVRDVHLLPIFASERLVDNHLIITPFAGEPLVSLVLKGRAPARERVGLLLQAVRGLRTLHQHRIVHGDFTLRNILVTGGEGGGTALLFDFDLAVALDLLEPTDYLAHYDGCIVGSPESSVAPEQLDAVLGLQPLSPRRDIYAVGTALWSLFTDASVYGEVADLPSLLQRISDGVVRRGIHRIHFPDEIPAAIREVILRCLERDPELRYPDADALVRALERAHASLAPRAERRYHSTIDYAAAPRRFSLAEVLERRPDASVTVDEIRETRGILARHGYLLARSLGRMKGMPIYEATPDPALIAAGRFLEPNTYPKIVTSIDLRGRPDAEDHVAAWLSRVKPILDGVRQAFLTPLHKAAFDRPSCRLLLFSEHIDDPRFGTELVDHELTLEEALGLALILASQVARLHERGLGHNNVSLEAILFKGLADSAEARPFLVGLVDPSFDPEVLAEDVQRLAGIVADLMRPSRIEEQPGDRRTALFALRSNLQAAAAGAAGVLPVAALVAIVEDGLALIERNFDVVRRHGGDPVAFARTMTRHSLYRRLWG